MKIAGLIRLAALLCLFASLPAVSSQDDLAAFDRSYHLSQNQSLNENERIFYLIELCHKSPELNAPAEKIKEWSMALFDAASKQQNPLSAVGQKNAVTSLSYVDPVAAMDLLDRVQFQRPSAGQWVLEDPRSNAAEKLFNNFLDKTPPQDFSRIIEKARYLGRTGQYPYWAMAEVIHHHSPAPTKDEINTTVSDALDFYTEEKGFYNRDEEFLYLLWGLKNSGVNRDLASRVVKTFVQRLQDDPIHFPGDYYAEVHISSNGKVFPFTDRNAAFLFQAFPVIRQYNPPLAAKLSLQDLQLNQAIDNMSYISGGFIQGDPRSEQAAEKHLQWLQESLIRRIKERQDCPESAAQLAQRLSDSSSRIVGFSTVVQGMAKSDLSKAHAIYESQRSALDDLDSSPSSNRLRAMSALAVAANSVDEPKQYEGLGLQAFDIGIALFDGDNTAPRAQTHSGFKELQNLIAFAASQPTDILQTKVNGLRDNWLKAYLLLYEAEGHAKRKTSPVVAKPCPD